jgi:glycosyltransferase involved in cell wall biosynthesis
VICISEYTRRRLIALTDVDPAKVVVIPHGIRGSNFPSNKIRPASGRPYILYVGNRSGYKNFQVLEKAFSELIKSHKDLILCLVGGGPLHKSELSRFEVLGINSNIRIANQTEELNELIDLAQCVVSTSLVEGFGLVPLEALNQQTPCVITDIEVNREIWNETLPTFSPKDYIDLAAQIKHLLDSDEHWCNVSKNGFAVAQSLSIERMVKSTMDIYKIVARGM